jgi:hypothetical protein
MPGLADIDLERLRIDEGRVLPVDTASRCDVQEFVSPIPERNETP